MDGDGKPCVSKLWQVLFVMLVCLWCCIGSYPCCWGGVNDGKPYVAGLEKFAEMVLSNLWNAVKKFYPAEVCRPVVISQSQHFV